MTDHQPPPPWIVSGPGEPAEPRVPGNRRLRVVLAAVLLIVVLAGAATLAARRLTGSPDDPPTAAPPTAAPPTAALPTWTETAETTPPTVDPPTADPEADALVQLEELSRAGLSQVSLDGQLVAQLASKTPGITDARQRAADGSHVFRATDILREHQALRDDQANGSATVLLLRSTDYGKRQLYNGRPLYVTFALRDFGSPQAVRDWCADRFPHLAGEDLVNQCAPRRLRTP